VDCCTRHLDLSNGSDDIEIPIHYEDPEEHLRYLVDSLPALTSLDISGTNLAGFQTPEAVSHKLGPEETKYV
jgi:hypothetical protein